MKKFIYLAAISFFLLPLMTVAQQENKDKKTDSTYTLKSEKLDQEGKKLDDQILELSKDIAQVIIKNKLIDKKDIKVLPYQFEYYLNKDSIEIQKHEFVKDEIYNRDLIGIRIKSMKIYISGETVSKIVYEIYENNHSSEEINKVLIEDPTPTSGGTDDINFKHIRYYTHSKIENNDEKPIVNKPLAKIKNSTAFPMRNEIKRQFLIPHLQFFKSKLAFIAESYYKSQKDSDGGMTEFLIRSQR